MDALLLIDLQYDFMPGGALAVPEGDAVVSLANQLMASFELVVATQDWHPADHCSFAENHPGHHVGDVVRVRELDQILWPTHCVQNSHGAELHTDLDRDGIHHITTKGTNPKLDSYSGFFDNGHVQATELGDFLQSRSVSRVVVVGLALDYCVKFTALDARQLGFETIIIPEACRAVNLQPGDDAAAIREMEDAGVMIKTLADFAAN